MNIEEEIKDLKKRGQFTDEGLRYLIEKAIKENSKEWERMIAEDTDEQIEEYWRREIQDAEDLAIDMGEEPMYSKSEKEALKLAFRIYKETLMKAKEENKTAEKPDQEPEPDGDEK